MRAKILSASAGSGKTYRLAYKYVHDVIADPSAYRAILAVTFTNKATEEMKSRIVAEIHRLAAGMPSPYVTDLCRDLSMNEHEVRQRARKARSNILHDYSRFTVLTIDRFFQRILRAFIHELGIDIDYSVELDSDPILEKSTEALIKNLDDDKELRNWLTDFCEEQLDDDRSWDIRDVVMRIGAELFKESNRDHISRAKSKQELKEIVSAAEKQAEAAREAVRKLAAEALETMRRAGVEHSDYNRSFTQIFERLEADPAAGITDTVRRNAASTDGWFRKGGAPAAAESAAEELRQRLAEILEVRDRSQRLWNTVGLIRANYRSFALLADLYAYAVRVCDEEKMMLLSETKHLLAQFVADSEAPFIYEKVGARFEKFMIDEFQDTSAREWLNFLPLLRNAMSQSDDNTVLLVGDVKQSIYRWRGGDRQILQNRAAQELGIDDTEVESLRENWRSLPEVVAFNNRMVRDVVKADNDSLNSEIEEARSRGGLSDKTAAELHDALAATFSDAEQIARKKAANGGFVGISVYADQPPVVERIKSIIDRGFKPKDIMILVREKSKGVEIAETLLAFKHANDDPRYKFDVMTQEALIIGSAPVVKFIIAALTLALDPENRIQCAVYRRFGTGKPLDEPLTEEEAEFFRSIRMLSPEEAFERTVMRFGLDREPHYTAYLQALHQHILNFSVNRTADTRMFLEWWNESGHRNSLNVEQGETTIEISTVHKAKGLEKKVVIIPCCDWKLDPRSSTPFLNNYIWAEPRGDAQIERIGTFPVSMKSTMGDSFFADDYFVEKVSSHIDNINLLYVALTRAVEELHIFIPEPSGAKGCIDSVGRLMLSVLPDEEFADDGKGCRHLSFGTAAAPCTDDRRTDEVRSETIRLYSTHAAQMQLRLPSQRYFDDGAAAAEMSPRSFGILMHRAFENAESAEDINAAVEQMICDGVVSKAEAAHLRQMTDKALADLTVRSWFEKDPHAEVRNENDIVIPHRTTTKRPDRVIIRGSRATVVDYKFGSEKNPRYEKQVAEYAALLKKMGYSEIEGYIWYVTMGEIVKV